MLYAMDTQTQLFLFTSIVLGSFFLGNAMDGVFGGDGFGIFGNMLIIAAGFFIGIWVSRYLGYPIGNFRFGIVVGLAGSFVSLLVLAVLKAVLNRL
jgi:hypothetical protein